MAAGITGVRVGLAVHAADRVIICRTGTLIGITALAFMANTGTGASGGAGIGVGHAIHSANRREDSITAALFSGLPTPAPTSIVEAFCGWRAVEVDSAALEGVLADIIQLTFEGLRTDGGIVSDTSAAA